MNPSVGICFRIKPSYVFMNVLIEVTPKLFGMWAVSEYMEDILFSRAMGTERRTRNMLFE